MPDLDTATDAQALAASRTVSELAARFAAIVAPLGMTASASGMVSGPRAVGSSPFHFANWPADWLAVYVQRKYVTKDPCPRWAIVSGEPVSWSELMGRLPASDPAHEVFDAARAWGFGEGFVTPIRTRDGALGLVSVGGPPRPPFSALERLRLEELSAVTLRTAEALMGPPADAQPLPVLSLRERECVSLLRQGFTDPEIGKVLGISGETVRFHLGNARKKVGARNRVHLAAWSSQTLEAP